MNTPTKYTLPFFAMVIVTYMMWLAFKRDFINTIHKMGISSNIVIIVSYTIFIGWLSLTVFWAIRFKIWKLIDTKIALLIWVLFLPVLITKSAGYTLIIFIVCSVTALTGVESLFKSKSK